MGFEPRSGDGHGVGAWLKGSDGVEAILGSGAGGRHIGGDVGCGDLEALPITAPVLSVTVPSMVPSPAVCARKTPDCAPARRTSNPRTKSRTRATDERRTIGCGMGGASKRRLWDRRGNLHKRALHS